MNDYGEPLPWKEIAEQPPAKLPDALEERFEMLESKIAAWLTGLLFVLLVLGTLAFAHIVSLIRG
jgi:hypothetical protein